MSEEIEFHEWLGKKKGAVFHPQVFFSGIALILFIQKPLLKANADIFSSLTAGLGSKFQWVPIYIRSFCASSKGYGASLLDNAISTKISCAGSYLF